jgi:predicted phosphate transport protein (TIGR00153 family)
MVLPLLNMFGPSPIRPLQEHIAKANSCAQTLLPFFQCVLQNNWAQAHQMQEEIIALERAADQIKRDLRLNLPKSLFLPVSRGDILVMLTTQDMIANKAKDVAGLVFGRHMQVPEPIAPAFMHFLECCLAACQQAQCAINELDELLEAGFRGNEVQVIQEMISQLDKQEETSDSLQVVVRQGLFKLESNLSAIDVMFLYEIIELVGDLADNAHGVGGQLQLLLAR